tara:strand:- start:799 stop:1122 length:324 start_codon:yes stop_codon:yes gene_type:complete
MRKIKHPSISQIELTDIMYAFSDPIRVEMIRDLIENDRPMTCGELNRNRPKSSMSHHFKTLRETGVLETTIEGKEHLNTLRLNEINEKFPSLLYVLFEIIKKNRVLS